MLVFMDESFRTHKHSGAKFGVLGGVAIAEDAFGAFQRDWYFVCKLYFGQVLKPEDEVRGKELLSGTTLKHRGAGNHSPHWSLAEDLVNSAARQRFRVFAVVCFRDELHSFVNQDAVRLDDTFRFLFERIDGYMHEQFPTRFAKIIFDNRDHKTNERNALASTNFFLRSPVGLGYDRIIKTPFFGVSQANNAGLQLADLVTTVIAHRFQGSEAIAPLWNRVRGMVYHGRVGERSVQGLKLIRDKTRNGPAT